MQSKKGITLIELVIAMALLGMVLTSAYSMLTFSHKVHVKAVDEFDLQSSFRLVTEHTNRIARFSTALFTIPRSSFRENNLSDGWNYIGIIDNAIVAFEYVGAGVHQEKVLVPADPNISYKIVFNKINSDPEERVLGFSIQAFVNGNVSKIDESGNPIGHINLLSEAETLNSLQIIYKGTPTDPAVALAYRSEDRNAPEYQIERPVAQVAMVLDTSGSMAWNLNGNNTNIVQDRRITKLKNSASDLIDKFAASQQTVRISLIPFDTDANNPGSFYDATTQTSTLKTGINNLSAVGGTNTGDGLRRGYHRIKNGRTSHGGSTSNDYIILLVDGNTTYGTELKSNNNFLTGDGNFDNRDHRLVGSGSENSGVVNRYVETIGNMIVNDGNITMYVIGFSNRSHDLDGLELIADYTNAKKIFRAEDSDELDLVFDEIKKQILNDLWHIDGPEL